MFIYGTYGLQHAAWAAKIQSCSGGFDAAKGRLSEAPSAARMPVAELEDDFETHARSVLRDDPGLLGRLLALRGEVTAFAAQRIPGFAPPDARTLNARNQHLIDQAAILLGPERFERVFGFPPDRRVNLVIPGAGSDQPR